MFESNFLSIRTVFPTVLCGIYLKKWPTNWGCQNPKRGRFRARHQSLSSGGALIFSAYFLGGLLILKDR